MTKYIIAAFAALALALGGWGTMQTAKVERLQLDIERKDRAIEAQRKALADALLSRDVLDAHLKRVSEKNIKVEQALSELRKVDGYDAPLSDFLDGFLDGVRPVRPD